MEPGDYRQQQELEIEREQRCLEVLERVSLRIATGDDLLFLAAELGLTAQFMSYQHRPKRRTA